MVEIEEGDGKEELKRLLCVMTCSPVATAGRVVHSSMQGNQDVEFRCQETVEGSA